MNETKIIDAANGWKQSITTTICPVHRTGFWGVWDALKSWITGQPRLTVDKEVTVSMYFKNNASLNPTVEIGPTAKPYGGEK